MTLLDKITEKVTLFFNLSKKGGIFSSCNSIFYLYI